MAMNDPTVCWPIGAYAVPSVPKGKPMTIRATGALLCGVAFVFAMQTDPALGRKAGGKNESYYQQNTVKSSKSNTSKFRTQKGSGGVGPKQSVISPHRDLARRNCCKGATKTCCS